MKITLAPEALFRPESASLVSDHELNESFENAGPRVREVDPDGKRGLALIKEMDEQIATGS